MKLRLKEENADIDRSLYLHGWYCEGRFFIEHYSSKMKIYVKREITDYADEEMKTYFKLLDLLDESIWALGFKLIYKDGYYDIDIDSIH